MFHVVPVGWWGVPIDYEDVEADVGIVVEVDARGVAVVPDHRVDRFTYSVFLENATNDQHGLLDHFARRIVRDGHIHDAADKGSASDIFDGVVGN